MALTLVIAFANSGGAGDTAVSPSADSRAQGIKTAARATPPEKCPSARKALRFYQRRYAEHEAKMGAAVHVGAKGQRAHPRTMARGCPRYLAHLWQRKAYAMRVRVERWLEYHYHWAAWLPDKWQRIGACETGYGRRPGNWRHSNSSYEGAFGFAKSSWDAFKYRAARKAGPYPEDAWQATPRQQYEVALAIYRAFGFSGWGCRGA